MVTTKNGGPRVCAFRSNRFKHHRCFCTKQRRQFLKRFEFFVRLRYPRTTEHYFPPGRCCGHGFSSQAILRTRHRPSALVLTYNLAFGSPVRLSPSYRLMMMLCFGRTSISQATRKHSVAFRSAKERNTNATFAERKATMSCTPDTNIDLCAFPL